MPRSSRPASTTPEGSGRTCRAPSATLPVQGWHGSMRGAWERRVGEGDGEGEEAAHRFEQDPDRRDVSHGDGQVQRRLP